MGNKVPWKTGVLIYLPVTSRPLISLQKEAVLSPCNFATTRLTACILNFYLPWTSRPMKRRTLSQRPNIFGRLVHNFAWKLVSRTSKQVSRKLGHYGNRGFRMITLEATEQPNNQSHPKESTKSRFSGDRDFFQNQLNIKTCEPLLRVQFPPVGLSYSNCPWCCRNVHWTTGPRWSRRPFWSETRWRVGAK